MSSPAISIGRSKPVSVLNLQPNIHQPMLLKPEKLLRGQQRKIKNLLRSDGN